MEGVGARDADPDEPTAFGHQPTEALPSSAALGEKPVSRPDERAGRPGARDSGRERAEDAEGPGEAFYSITRVTRDIRETAFLKQPLSIGIQRENAI